jgi:hypothetical protein
MRRDTVCIEILTWRRLRRVNHEESFRKDLLKGKTPCFQQISGYG